MSDDDLKESSPARTLPSLTDSEVLDSVVLPESASAYYSPRPIPAATSHATVETEAVRLDPSIDPTLASTHRVSVEGLDPPPWLATPPRSDSPTVLVPVVRARRRKRRVVWGIGAAIVGAVLGIVFGLARGPSEGDTPGASQPSVATADLSNAVAARPAVPVQSVVAPVLVPPIAQPSAHEAFANAVPSSSALPSASATEEGRAASVGRGLRVRHTAESRQSAAPTTAAKGASSPRAWFE
jgi:hypothetical protein